LPTTRSGAFRQTAAATANTSAEDVK